MKKTKNSQLKILLNHNPEWIYDPELFMLDYLLNNFVELENIVKKDYESILPNSNKGRQRRPSAQQVVRGAIYMKLKGLTYDELWYHQYDSKIAAIFLQIELVDGGFARSTWHKYISSIRPETLQDLLKSCNKIAILNNLDSPKKLRIDSTVIESDIHYPTNNSLLWDCIRKANDCILKVPESIRNSLKVFYLCEVQEAKSNYFKINNIKKKDPKYKELFLNQIDIFERTISYFYLLFDNITYLLKENNNIKNRSRLEKLIIQKEEYEILFDKVIHCCNKHEIAGKKVLNSEKVFSIHESHTNIIVKGSREVSFGHKVNLSTGKNSIIFSCDILEGNPSDSNLYKEPLQTVTDNYNSQIDTVSTDGGYASLKNLDFAKSLGIKEIVFNKVIGKLQNHGCDEEREIALKKWRSGIEANISNLKRKFNLRRVRWKNFSGFCSEVLWSVIAYNIRRMACLALS